MATASAARVHDKLDRPLRVLRLSVTDDCNFRCTYCMPKELFGEGYPFLPPAAMLNFEEIGQVVRAAVPLGVTRIKITGGEPLLRPGVHRLIEQIASIDGIEDIGLITNGYHLPRSASYLWKAGLRRITISLDSIDPHTFTRIADRAHGLEAVLEGIDVSIATGFDPIKANMVVQRGVNDGQVLDMARFARERGIELRFIEYMDVGRRHDFDGSLVVANREIRDQLDRTFGIVPLTRDSGDEVAETYEYRDGGGRVGFISSMSEPFCGSCTRLRISADGKAYRCLFSGIGLDLRAILRDQRMTGEERFSALSRELRMFWAGREDRYSELRGNGRPQNGTRREERIEMFRMGG